MKKRIKKPLIVLLIVCITGPLSYTLIYKENQNDSDSKILQEFHGGSKKERKNDSTNSGRRVGFQNYNSYAYTVIENDTLYDKENAINLVSYNNLTNSGTKPVPNFPNHNGSENINKKSNYIRTMDEKRANTSKASRLEDESVNKKRKMKTVADIKEEQDRRRKVVEEVCNAFGVQRDVQKAGSSLSNNVQHRNKEKYVDSVSMNHFCLARSTSSMTCLLNKVASTSLAVALLQSDGRPIPEWNDRLSPHNAVAVLHPQTEAEFKFARKYFFKFLLVRHPFERLLSAYRDKVERANHWSLKSFRKHIEETLKNNSWSKNALEGVPKAHSDTLLRGGSVGTNLLENEEEIFVNLSSDSLRRDGDNLAISDKPLLNETQSTEHNSRVVAHPTEESRFPESHQQTNNRSPGASIRLGNTRELNYPEEIHAGEKPSSTAPRSIENSSRTTEASDWRGIWQAGTHQEVITNENKKLHILVHDIKIPGENMATQTSSFKHKRDISPPAVPTFGDFLEYVLLSNVTDDPFSSHWSRYWETCSPCSISYDVIAKLESAEEDLQYPEPFKGEWPKETEEGEYEAVFLRARCVQVSLILDVIGGREDCLHLSIYTPVFPETPVTRTLPVMVWFHGGAYMTGDANLYVPTKLMDRDVMVVVVQYRLASFGFLAGNMEDSPGNMGLMDQITALRWIQNYIKNFGGNRDQVTVFGQSAGGASTSWMQLTPLTNGSAPANEGRDLFHRAIPQSGSALELWTIDPNPDDGFTQTASILNCNSGEDKAAMLSCMRAKDYTEIYNASVTLYAQDRINGGLGFKGLCPVVQDSLKGASVDFELVIPSPPLDILGQGDFMRVPMMAGAVRDEGSLVIGLAYKDYMEPLGHYTNDTDFVKYEAVSTLIRAFGLDDVNSAVANSMRVAYFPNAEMGNWDSMIGGMIDMTGVLFLKSGLWSVASHINRVAPDVPIYFYSWEFESDDSLFPWIFFSKPDIPVPGGTAHADELLYLFHLPSDQDEREKNMTDKMITLWTNFAKYGDPTPDSVNDESDSWEEKVVKWERYTNDDYNFMLMKDEFEMAQDFTTRWNYHRKEDVAEAPSRKDLAEMSTGERSEGEGEAPQAAPNDAEPGNDKNFKTTLVIFEGFLVLVVVSGCIYAIVRRQNGRRNGIV